MARERAAGSELVVVHVLPRDLARGAQVFARALRDRLDGPEQRHRTLTIFRGPPGALDPDHRLDLPPGRLQRLGYDPRVTPRLRQELAALAPDVVVAHGGEPLKYCVPARPPGSRLVYYKVGSSRRIARRMFRAAWHGRLIRQADTVVAISDDLATEAVDVFGADPTAVAVIPNGRDPSEFDRGPIGAAADRDRPPRLAFVGRMEPAKRPLWFLDIVRKLAEHHPRLRGIMVGDGPLLPEVVQRARDLPVDVLGRRDDVPALLAASDVLVSPSAREGMPGVLIEAGMSGLPVITTDVAGARTVVDDGRTGFVVGTRDLDGLIRRTAELLADPARRRAMGDAARERCTARFSLDAVARTWAELLAGTPSGRAPTEPGPGPSLVQE